ncbi:Ger(x)C family spore germination protein [Paenibacillus hodogayensis]|uniref:Ger(X)C family spore germination protein n=1 Tax=Paenibacillus hodogayensis TaxID=279208 RepID=A0ABV5VVK5_9BACL
MRRAISLLVPLLFAALLSGCWDIKVIQDTDYITAVGFDYKDGQFVIHAQMVDFANVAKPESGKKTGPVSVWAGKSQGGTVVEAMNQLYATAQQRMFWGHVSSIVFSERALRHGIDDFKDGLIRFREVRYTQWVYATREQIDDVFVTLPFFHQSPLGSILFQPEDSYRQRSFIRPLRLQKVVANYREPGSSLLLPCIAIAKGVWKEGGRDDPKLMVDGMFVLSPQKPAVWMGDAELLGLRWVEEDTKRSNVMLKREGKTVASVSVDRPKVKITPINERQYALSVKGKLVISELLAELSEGELTRLAESAVADEIRHTFAIGRKRGLDIYQFNHTLYHDRFRLWSRATQNGAKPLDDLALGSIDVDLHLTHSGMYRLGDSHDDY